MRPCTGSGRVSNAAEPEPPQYRGAVIIEWPASRNPGTVILPGWKVAISDALTGTSITTVTGADITIHADPSKPVTATLVMFADPNGNPVYDGTPHLRDGEVLTAAFPFLVAEIRIAGQPLAGSTPHAKAARRRTPCKLPAVAAGARNISGLNASARARPARTATVTAWSAARINAGCISARKPGR